MNHAITWNDYITVRVLVGLSIAVVGFVVMVVRMVIEYHDDCHANDEDEDDRPGAGKVLGL